MLAPLQVGMLYTPVMASLPTPVAPTLLPTTLDAEVREAMTEAQRRMWRSLNAESTEAWWRTYWRANPHKKADAILQSMPKIVLGAGEHGEHVHRIVHAIPRSPLDDVNVIEGQVIQAATAESSLPPVPLRQEPEEPSSGD